MKNLICIALVASAILLSSCEGIWPDCVEGNGVIFTENRDVSAFTGVESNGDFEVNIFPGEESGVTVEADENLMDLIITRVSGDELIIETRHGNCIRSSDEVRVTVTVPGLNRIDLNGSGTIWCDSLSTSYFNAELDGSGTIRCVSMMVSTLDVEISGSGKMETDGTFTVVNTVIDGSGEAILSGETPTADLHINGSGRITADNLLTDTCYANITSSGTIYIRVIDLLEVDISGSGIVYYYGDNPVINTNITGSGQVIKKNGND
jgi:hypothetical protein